MATMRDFQAGPQDSTIQRSKSRQNLGCSLRKGSIRGTAIHFFTTLPICLVPYDNNPRTASRLRRFSFDLVETTLAFVLSTTSASSVTSSTPTFLHFAHPNKSPQGVYAYPELHQPSHTPRFQWNSRPHPVPTPPRRAQQRPRVCKP